MSGKISLIITSYKLFSAQLTFMKQLRILSSGLLIFLSVLSAQGQGFLKTNGKLIVDDKNQKVILRGMGLGGWQLQEGYMYKLGFLGQQYRIKESISDLIGPKETDLFYEKWLANHTRKIDIDSMAAWGFNSIRLPMHYNLYTLPVEEEKVKGQNTWLSKGFEMTDSLLAWCKANKMYLILDLHATPGGQGNDLAISDRDPAKPSLWESEENQQKTIALWRKLAERYKDEPWIGGYDIINEPNWGFESKEDFRGTAENKNEPLRKLMMDITKAIREVDQKHIIIIEGNGFGNNYRGVLPLWDNNTVLSFHKYGNFNETKAIQNFLDLSAKNNVPLWLGESGENSNNWFTEAIGLVESNDIGWAWWQNKKMGINNPLEIKQPEGYQKLVNYWLKKGEKPTAAEAQKILNELLENLKLENNIYHRDVTDAMFRQIHSKTTKPFKPVTITKSAIIKATDFDLGPQRQAYFDRDTASYHYTPGVNTKGNRGNTYRNDGVDIRADKNGEPYVFSFEDGEWLKYSVQAKSKKTFIIKLKVSAENKDGVIAFLVNEKPVAKLPVPQTGGEETWQKVEIKNVSLAKGSNVLKVVAEKGGFTFKEIEISDK